MHGPTYVFSPQSSALQHSQKRCPMAVTHSEGLLGPPPLVALAVLALLGGLVYLCTLCAACRRYVPGNAVCFRAAPHTQIPAEALVCTEGEGLHPKKLVPAGGEAVVVMLEVDAEWMNIGWVNVGAMLGGCLQDADGVLRVPGHWSCVPSWVQDVHEPPAALPPLQCGGGAGGGFGVRAAQQFPLELGRAPRQPLAYHHSVPLLPQPRQEKEGPSRRREAGG